MSQSAALAIRSELFIGGDFVPSLDGASFQTLNPATGELLVDVSAASAADVDRAVAAARTALDGPWGSLELPERASILRRISGLIVERADAIAHLECLDVGKPLEECRAGVMEAAQWFDFFADIGQHLRTFVVPTVRGQFTYTLRAPIGVVGLITPWNYPMPLYGIKVPAALATGNTIVLKPAEQTPLTALALAEICAEAGVPDGVFNVITGDGPVTGRALVEHPDVGMISFTGSTAVGREIAATAGRHLKRVSLELGGKSPNIVFADADLDQAAATSAFTFSTNQGQLCSAGTRLIVERSIHDQFVAALCEHVEALRIGDPFDARTNLGAVISAPQLERIQRYVELGGQAGGQVVTGGTTAQVSGFEGGNFYTPTIFTGLDQDAQMVQEEVFGPVLTVHAFADEAEALRLANGVPYGLAAGLWTRDISRMLRLAERIEAGIVWGNTMNMLSPSTPYSGWKQSGLGTEGGQEQAEEFTRVKTVWIDTTSSAPRYIGAAK